MEDRRRAAAELADIGHGDPGDQGIGQSLGVDALLDQVRERGAGNQHVVEVETVGRFLGDVHADVAVADRAADQIQVGNLRAGSLADAVDRPVDVDIFDPHMIDAVAEHDAPIEARDADVLDSDVVGGDGDAGSRAGNVVGRGSLEEFGNRSTGRQAVERLEGALNDDVADADDRDLLVDGDVFGVAARRDEDRVAGVGSIDRRLNRGIAAGPDQQEIVPRAGVGDPFDVVEQRDAVGAGFDLPARLIAGSRRIGIGHRGDCPGDGVVGDRVDPDVAVDRIDLDARGSEALDRGDRAADADDYVDRVVAGRAGYDEVVGAGAAGNGVGAVAERVPDDVVAAAAVDGIGARAADQLVIVAAAGQRVVVGLAEEQIIAGSSVERVLARAADELVGAAVAMQ